MIILTIRFNTIDILEGVSKLCFNTVAFLKVHTRPLRNTCAPPGPGAVGASTLHRRIRGPV